MNIRHDWDSLKELCEKAGLPVPVIEPAGLRDKVFLSIGNSRFMGENMSTAIGRARLYVQGYGDHIKLLENQRIDSTLKTFKEWREWLDGN